jgi:septal ring factor EnvC (AmiA/AmiB activator)
MMAAGSDESPLVEELLRVNAELAAEVRALSSDRSAAPRPGRVPAAREIARLRSEHEALAPRLEETQAALAASEAAREATQAALEEVQAHREGLERQNQALAAEIAGLRTGLSGLARRARRRLLARTGLFSSR